VASNAVNAIQYSDCARLVSVSDSRRAAVTKAHSKTSPNNCLERESVSDRRTGSHQCIERAYEYGSDGIGAGFGLTMMQQLAERGDGWRHLRDDAITCRPDRLAQRRRLYPQRQRQRRV
jgi:hypothetical protein